MIEISQLNFGYSKKKPLFQNLSLSLEPGHIYGILGKNGAGKSTLLKNICGLVFPTSGSCKVNGVEARKRLPSFLEDIFLIPEDVYLPSVSIRKFLANTSHFYPKFDTEQFFRILDEFEVPADSNLKGISFGQQKKVIIAFGIASNTSLLVMDEPTNGLDIPSKVQFRKIIASSLTEGRCVLISTHQVRDLDSLIDRLVVIHNREVMLNSSIDEISDRLFFMSGSTEAESIYSEKTASGTQSIRLNSEGRHSKVDLELLFNAVVSNEKSVVNALNH